MLEFSERVIRLGYTIFINKNPNTHKLQGTYLKSFNDGIHPSDLPEKELMPFQFLANINQYLDEGALLQIHQDGYQTNGVLGKKATEGPYCETEYLEVIGQKSEFSYHEMLIDLDVQLAQTKSNQSNNAIQYTKLYKGVDRYE